MEELKCVHGVSHSNEVHGCDGCCFRAFPISEEAIEWLKKKENQVRMTASLDTLLDMRDQLKKLKTNKMLQNMSGTDIIEFLIENIERQVWESGEDKNA